MAKPSNALIHETSPYLLQHAHNPVDWQAWNKDTLKLALEANKPLIISVGYSACHWCHVMEHESFEDEDVAKYMNEHFTCIKVDREERPDVDQLYMNTAHLTTGRGGWPLNCFALPDGRPFYATTYLPKDRWLRLLSNIVKEFKTDKMKIIGYANNIMQGLKQTNFVQTDQVIDNRKELVAAAVDKWKLKMDPVHGGMNPPPKFPMPNNYQFLLTYAEHANDDELRQLVRAALDGMCHGGIYDHVGGGITRYSVDGLWKLPHFEKMLYDNGQILSFYSKASLLTQNSNYKNLVEQTIKFASREMSCADGGYYAAYDADSEGEEGRYYVWTEKELESCLGEGFNEFKTFFYLDQNSYWEEEKHLIVRKPLQVVLEEDGYNEQAALSRINQLTEKLRLHREGRAKPGLDDKIITSWNALQAIGLVNAFVALGDSNILDEAQKLLEWLLNDRTVNLEVYRIKNPQTTINGFLDDYALFIQALTEYGMVSGETNFIHQAYELTTYVIQNFYSEEQQLFYYSKPESDELVVKNVEYFDSVIPSSNSVMCYNLICLGRFYHKQEWLTLANKMIDCILPQSQGYPAGFGNWFNATMFTMDNSLDIVVTGPEGLQLAQKLRQVVPPYNFVLHSNDEQLPIAENRVGEKNQVFICSGNTCYEPVSTVDQVLETIKKASNARL